jgi:hypothetical protein
MKFRPTSAIVLIGLVCWFLVAMFVRALVGSDRFEQSARVVAHDTYDPRGIVFFELKLGSESVVLSADADTAIARWLRHKDRVRIVVSAVEPEALAR